jgi:D-glycero-alpha-D-manno-heptose-7-phosphate kinase
MKAFSEWTEKKFIDVHHMVRVAHNLEAQILNTPTGTQDYYPAVTGGLSLIDYNSDQINQQVMDFSGTPLETHFLLVYTGKTHHSGLNNFEVLKSAVAKDQVVLKALNEIKIISTDLEQVLKNQSWSEIPDLFKREYSARVQLTPAFTSPEINFLSELVLANGGLGVKICGAGGGGCVLVWVAPENRQKVIEACEKEKFQCLNSKPVHPEKHQLKKWLMLSDS